jgi:hypothetical protein
MQATIIAHEKPAETSSEEIHRFRFQLDDDESGRVTDSISLRTARVIVENLEDGNAFIQMLRVIVSAEPVQYDSLIGCSYFDKHHPRPI